MIEFAYDASMATALDSAIDQQTKPLGSLHALDGVRIGSARDAAF